MLNKWFSFAISTIGVLAASASALDWTSIVGVKTSATIAAVAGVVKMVTATLAPGAGQTAVPTGGTLFTHENVNATPQQFVPNK